MQPGVADGRAPGHGLPAALAPHVDPVVGDVLPELDGLLEPERVEGCRCRQLHLQPRRRRAAGGAPVRVRVGIEHRARRAAAAGAGPAAGEHVALEEAAALRVERLEGLHVAVVEQPVAGRRHVEQQLAVAADGTEIQPHQVVGAAHPLVLIGVPEPAGPDRDVGFAGAPDGAVRVALHQRRLHPRRIEPGPRHPIGIDRAPAGRAGLALLVADPADVRSAVAEHHRIRLQAPDGGMDPRPVVGCWRLPLGPSPLAPSNHTSTSGP